MTTRRSPSPAVGPDRRAARRRPAPGARRLAGRVPGQPRSWPRRFRRSTATCRPAFEPRRDAARQTAAAVARQLPPPSPATPAPRPGAGGDCSSTPLPAGVRGRRAHRPRPASCSAARTAPTNAARARRRRTRSTRSPSSGCKPRAEAGAAEVGRARGRARSSTRRPGEKRRVVLPDGSFLYLNQNTTVELAERSARQAHRAARCSSRRRPGQVGSRPVRRRNAAAVGHRPRHEVRRHGDERRHRRAGHAGQGRGLRARSEPSRRARSCSRGDDKIAPAPRASAALDWTRDLMAAAESPLVPAGKHGGGALVAVDPDGQEAKLTLRKYHVDVHIEDGFARTTIDQTYFNSENSADGRDVLLPAAAGRLAVAAGDVRRRRPDGRRHGRARPRPRRLRDASATRTATRPCSNGWTAARSRCASSRWKPGRRSASSSATRSSCRCSTAERPTASRPGTPWRWSATGRSTARQGRGAAWPAMSPSHPTMKLDAGGRRPGR